MVSYNNDDIVIIKAYNGENYHAGSKARNDVDLTFDKFSSYYVHNYSLNNDVYVDEGNSKNIKYYLVRSFNLIRTFFEFKKCKNKILLIQYPPLLPQALVNKMHFLYRNNKTIFLVHDVDSIRYGTDKKIDINMLNLAKVVIVHNEAMAAKLVEMGMTAPHIEIIGLFDYLVKEPLEDKKYKKAVVFAGNLGKSDFLREWIHSDRNYDLELYGVNFPSEEYKNSNKINYNGKEPPDILPCKISGGFGLVWDGTSIDTCSGTLGNYMKYNNPHKFSLYIASGIPVIVWEKSAIAAIVKKYEIGYCVDNLNEINQIMNKLSEEEYNTLKSNVQVLQKKVVSGYFSTTAVNKALFHIIGKPLK